MNENFVTQQLGVHVMSTLNFEFVEKGLEVFFLLVGFPVRSCRYILQNHKGGTWTCHCLALVGKRFAESGG